MVSREALAMAELDLAALTVLAAVVVAGEEECVGDLAAEAAGDVHELDEAYDGGSGERESFAADDVNPSASTISAFPSITSRSARRTGTMVSGSNEAFNARHRTTRPPGHDLAADLPES